MLQPELQLTSIGNNHKGLYTKVRVATSDCVYYIDPADIVRIESISNYSRIIFLNSKSILVAKVLAHFEVLLKDFHFLRIHRTHLVNLIYIKQYERGSLSQVGLNNNEMLPVARSKKKIVQQELKNHSLS